VRRAVHQVLVGATSGDAITGMAIQVRDRLRLSGNLSEIYAHFLDPTMASEVHPLEHLPRAAPRDVLMYHASYGAPEVTACLLGRPEPIVLIHHNITPAEYFIDHQPDFALGLQWGRHELSLLRDRVVLAVADSGFNASELESVGYVDVHVIPAGLRPSRLKSVGPDPGLATALHARFPDGYVLGVSQLLPHKRFETVVEAMHLVRWVHEMNLGLVIVGAPRMPGYKQALEHHASSLCLRQWWLPGSVSESQLATFFRLATMFVSASAHEGLALPPLEAMSFAVPVIARSAGAIAETVGDAGIVLPPESGPMLLSEAIAELNTNHDLRRSLIRRGTARVAEIERGDPAQQLATLLAEVG
jgi:glycosyltransferase involved in cell wall biosynthesis